MTRQEYQRSFSPVFLVLVSGTIACIDVATRQELRLERAVEKMPKVDLSSYSVLYIEDFEITDPSAFRKMTPVQLEYGRGILPDFVRHWLTYSRDAVFFDVKREPVKPEQGSLVLQGEMERYGTGLSGSSLRVSVRLVDPNTRERIVVFSITRSSSSSLVDVERLVGRELAEYLIRCKGGEASQTDP